MANYYYVKNSIKPISIGFEGENDAWTIVFDISRWIEDYGNGTALLVHQRPGDAEPYPCATEQKAGTIEWAVQQADLVTGGYGRAQISYKVGDNIVARSPIYKTVACASISAAEAGEPGQDWINDVLDAAAQAETSATNAANSAETAKQAETAATQAATSAAADANAAAQSEANASKSASAAAGSATAASDSATAAAGSAETAQTAATTATDAAGQAQASQTAAAGSASAAAESATQAAGSQTAAKNSEDAAAASATAAAGSAEQAAQSVAEATQAAQEAKTSATAAGIYYERAADFAAASENSAALAQSAANTSASKAGEASASASAAAASEAAAAQSAQTAQTAATSTAGSVESAAASATAAANSAGQAAQSVASIGNSVEQAQAAASTAATKASEAAQSAEAAQESADDIKELVPIPTLNDNGKVMTVVDGKWAARDPGYPAETWADIQKIVRLGAAPRYFPVGYEFVTHDSTEDTDIIWRVVGYDTIKAADESLTHTMILETKYAYSKASGVAISIQFGQLQALYHCQNQLEAGTYNFTLMNADIAVGGGKTYTFTLSNPVPAGGVLTFPWIFGINAETVKIISFASNLADEPIETVSVSVGSDGTSLGLVDGTVEGLNYQDRFRYGSNNYAQSAIRQWLNSSESAGNVWIPKTKFDRPPIYKNSISGFMSGLPEDFLSVVKPASVPCYTNKIYEVDGLDGSEYGIMEAYALTDMFFLLSRTEIYGPFVNQSVSGADGEQLEFYKDLTDSERIKYDVSGSAKTVWTRSNTEFTAYAVYNMLPTGTVSNGTAGASTYGVCPACIIA